MTASEWTIPDLLQLSGGYWSTCALHAAVQLDFFSILDGGARTSEDVATSAATEPRATAMLLDALVALGLLEKSDSTYQTTPFASACLAKKTPGYLGHIIMHHHHLVEGWSRLSEAVVSGVPVRKKISHDAVESVRESFLMGMFNLASLLAPKIAKSIDLSACQQLLDLGGGPGTYAIHFCLANPQLSAQIYDLPTTRQFAEATVERFTLSERVHFTPGDYLEDPVPTGFDAAWLSHVLHADGPESCKILLRKAVAALNPGGMLLIQEFIMNDEKNGPLFPALFSLNMLIGTEKGQSYSQKELTAMMKDAGLSDISRLDIDLPNGAGIMLGRKL